MTPNHPQNSIEKTLKSTMYHWDVDTYFPFPTASSNVLMSALFHEFNQDLKLY